MGRKRDIKAVDAVAARLGLSREQRELLHRENEEVDLTFQELLELAKDVKQDYPRKRGRWTK